MSGHFDHVVVGGGPMGSAAAKYLAASGATVLLIAAPEPSHRVPGLHSSHGDVSRITRGLDSNTVWAKMATDSLNRYRDLERRTGIPFYTETGCLTLLDLANAENTGKALDVQNVGREHGIDNEALNVQQLAGRVPALAVPPQGRGFYEKRAGWLNPLDCIRAQIVVGRDHGLEVWNEIMTSASVTPRGIEFSTADGRRGTADHALFAMGTHSLFDLPVPLDEKLTVYARTIVRVEVNDSQRAELDGLPSMIVRGSTDEHHCYLLPPMLYPDGRHYIKIGGGPRAQPLTSRVGLADWYAGDGDPDHAAALLGRLEELLPVTRPRRGITQACAITVTSSGLPRIEKIRPNVGILTGGNGHAAKSGDEAGRLGSQLMLGNPDWNAGYAPQSFSS